MAKPVQSITVVGGGTAGWLSAAFLSAYFENALRQGEMSITLIESPNIGIIGVGEASAAAMPRTLKQIGINESDFIKRTDAAFKLGGFFVNWDNGPDGDPTYWLNPFDLNLSIQGRSVGYYYNEFGRTPGTEDYVPDLSRVLAPSHDLIVNRKGPRVIGGADYTGATNYAYHTNAMALAEVLRDKGLERGVKHILDDVTEVHLDERGFVTSLDLKEHGNHPVELVIDSTGFRGVIIQQMMKEPFTDYGKYLLNDRAAAVQIPHVDRTSLEPTTRATALNCGWSFHVPLFNRVGTGYVYSSQHLSDDEAVDEFLAWLGPRGKGAEPRIIRWRVGKARRSWVNNCVALGLSSSFVEPLEATAIYSTEMGLRWLTQYFPDSEFSPATRDRYNRKVDQLYDEMVDYIVAHFHLSKRKHTEYWRMVAEDLPIPDTLAANLEVWKRSVPFDDDLTTHVFFSYRQYLTALMTKGFYDDVHFPQAVGLKRDHWRNWLNRQRAMIARTVDGLPDHYELLCSIRGEEPLQPSQAREEEPEVSFSFPSAPELEPEPAAEAEPQLPPGLAKMPRSTIATAGMNLEPQINFGGSKDKKAGSGTS